MVDLTLQWFCWKLFKPLNCLALSARLCLISHPWEVALLVFFMYINTFTIFLSFFVSGQIKGHFIARAARSEAAITVYKVVTYLATACYILRQIFWCSHFVCLFVSLYDNLT